MRTHDFIPYLPFAPLATAFSCTPSAFQAILPSNATVKFARSLEDDSTFHIPAGDIAYPVSPTHLRALCAVQINVTSSPSSAFSFGLFLPDEWNDRFLAVGNGGFAGGINWLDMVSYVKIDWRWRFGSLCACSQLA